MKTCTKCKIAQAESNFYRKGNRLNPQCKLCDRERKRKWRKANPEKVKAIRRKHYIADPEREAARKRKWREANLDRENETRRKRLEAKDRKPKSGKADSEMVEKIRRQLQVYFLRRKPPRP